MYTCRREPAEATTPAAARQQTREIIITPPHLPHFKSSPGFPPSLPYPNKQLKQSRARGKRQSKWDRTRRTKLWMNANALQPGKSEGGNLCRLPAHKL